MTGELDFSNFPLRVNLELAAECLGFSKQSMASQIDLLLQYQEVSDLGFRSKVSIEGFVQRVSDGVDEIRRPDGHLTLMSVGKSIPLDTKGEPVVLGQLSYSENGRFSTMSFSYDGDEYYMLDDEGMLLKSLSIRLEDIYIDKADLALCLAEVKVSLPAYERTGSDYYAPELALAIQLHEDIIIRSKIVSDDGLADKVSQWQHLNLPKEEWSGAKVSRMVTVIGPGKK